MNRFSVFNTECGDSSQFDDLSMAIKHAMQISRGSELPVDVCDQCQPFSPVVARFVRGEEALAFIIE